MSDEYQSDLHDESLIDQDHDEESSVSDEPTVERRNFLNKAATVAAVTGSMLVSSHDSAEAKRTKRSSSDKCKDTHKRKMAAGLRRGQAVERATQQLARSAREVQSTITRDSSRARQATTQLSRNIERYLELNRSGLATFIMVHDEK